VSNQDAERLENSDGSRTIIISSGGGKEGWKEEVDGVLVSTNNNGLLSLSGNLSDDGGLNPSMGKGLSSIEGSK